MFLRKARSTRGCISSVARCSTNVSLCPSLVSLLFHWKVTDLPASTLPESALFRGSGDVRRRLCAHRHLDRSLLEVLNWPASGAGCACSSWTLREDVCHSGSILWQMTCARGSLQFSSVRGRCSLADLSRRRAPHYFIRSTSSSSPSRPGWCMATAEIFPSFSKRLWFPAATGALLHLAMISRFTAGLPPPRASRICLGRTRGGGVVSLMLKIFPKVAISEPE